MSESSVVGVRRRRSRVEADRLVMEFERSGLTRQAFCAQHGLPVAALDKYRRRCALEKKPMQPRPAANRILPVELVAGIAPVAAVAAGSSRTLWVELANGRRIEVPQGFDASTLERLVTVLEGAAGNGRSPEFSSLRRV